MGRPGQFAKTLEPGLAGADCCGAVVCLDAGQGSFRHPVTCEDCWHAKKDGAA